MTALCQEQVVKISKLTRDVEILEEQLFALQQKLPKDSREDILKEVESEVGKVSRKGFSNNVSYPYSLLYKTEQKKLVPN